MRTDYSRYHGKHVRDIVTIPPVVNGKDLKRLTVGFLKPRAHALLFDTTINDVRNVRFNIYEIGVLAAMKFHVHALRLRQRPSKNSEYFIHIVIDTSNYMQWLVRDRTNNIKFPSCQCTLSDIDIKSAIIQSFVHVLSRKHSRYVDVLMQLKGMYWYHNGAAVQDRSTLLSTSVGVMF